MDEELEQEPAGVDEERQAAESESQPEPVRAAPRPAATLPPPQQPPPEHRPRFYNELGDEIPDGASSAHPAVQQFHAQQALLWNALPPSMKQQVMLDQIKLSQKQQIEMQKLQNAMGSVDANPYLNDEEKAHLKTQLQTRINPLVMRQARAKAMESEMAAQQLQQQVKQMAEMQTGQANERAKNFDKEVAVSGRQGGGESHMVFNPKTMQWYDPFEKERALQAKADEARAKHEADMKAKADELAVRHQEVADKARAGHVDNWHKEYDRVVKRVEERMAIPPGQPNAIHGDFEKTQGVADPKQSHIDEEMANRTGHKSAEEYAEAQMARRTSQARPTPRPAPGSPAAPQAGTAQPQAEPPPAAAPGVKPFAVHETEGENPFAEKRLDRSALDGSQQKMVGVLDSVRKRVEAKGFPSEKLKDEHVKDVDDMLRVLGRYGHPDAMPAEQLERWKKQLAYWNRLGVLKQ